MNPIENTLLYVLSGTGNTYRLACWVRDYLRGREIYTKLKFIAEAEAFNDIRDSRSHLLAVLFPTHGFMPPWSMIKFLVRLPRHKNTPAMVIATRGAFCIGPFIIPGAAGFATFFAALILLAKGYDVRGIVSLDMATNMNNFHPKLSEESTRKIAGRSHKRTTDFLARILSAKRSILTLNTLYEATWTILLFWFIPIFPLLYLLYGKTTMAKIMFANKSCVSCGRCARFCPNQAIEMKSFLGKKHPYWTYRCENCMRCMGYCKKQAVEAGHSWAIMQYFVVSIPVMATIISWVSSTSGSFFTITNYWLMMLIEVVYFLPALFLTYWLFWLLLRYPFVNMFFSNTSLTHYFRRYHEPETKLKDLG